MTAVLTRAATLVEALSRLVPADRLILDDDVLASLSHDEAEWAPVGRPAVGLRARSEAEVAAAVAVCADLGVPVVARGAGTGLSGGANAVDGCLVVDLSRMNRVVEIDAENVSTNAGGLCCLKYGVTRDYVLGMRAVMGGASGYGTPVTLGRKTSKGVAGYDLTGFIVGAEGTLGVVTEVTLRLRPALSGTPRTVVGAFHALVDAGRAVAAVTRAGLIPSALELLDRACLEAVEEWKHLGLEANAGALLLARVDTPGDAGAAEARALVAAFESADAIWATASTDDQEAELLFQARKLAYPALERLGPVLTEDLCVPRSKVPDMLAQVEAIGAANDVRIACIAHAGDGNLHPLILTPVGDDGARVRAELAFEQLLDAAIALGGTVTGEHGVGILKKGGMERELDPNALAQMRAVKAALDPLDVFNPGKVL